MCTHIVYWLLLCVCLCACAFVNVRAHSLPWCARRLHLSIVKVGPQDKCICECEGERRARSEENNVGDLNGA